MKNDLPLVPDVIVTRRNDPKAQYIGRGSPLGNPFRMDGEYDRDRVCDRYVDWLAEALKRDDAPVTNELERLADIALRDGEVRLGCYCAPKRCHGDTVRMLVLDLVMQRLIASPRS